MMKQDKIVKPGDFRKKPLWFRTLNALWEKSWSLGKYPRLDKDRLIASARRITGLNDLGKDFRDEPLERLIDSLNREARLHPLGHFISGKRIINLLAVRLRSEYWFKKHPEILDRDILPPMIIVGLQRTGTTKLHRLLTADPDNRVLRSWEAINPAPFHLQMNGKDRRIGIARTGEKALRYMAPGFFAIHPVEYNAPEEDILLLDVTFLSTTPEATAHVPSYAAWLEKTDQSAAYEYAGRLLRLLQWQQPGKRWILKSPHHLEFLPLAEKFLKATHYLWMHREPSRCIPSFLSMVCHSRSIFSDRVSLEEVRDHWVRKTTYMLEKGLAYRRSGENERKFTDILYEDLVGDPMAQLERIYQPLGGIGGDLRQSFRTADSENPYGKYGIHEYQLTDFGLDRAELVKQNCDYYNLFITLAGMSKIPCPEDLK
jgi:hypothetical protein